MNPTPEQKAAIDSDETEIVVEACAGSGKTSMLVLFAERRPRARFLYMAYNRAIKEEAERKFPSNVKCMTAHGVAYGKFGKFYAGKLGNLKPYHLAGPLELPMQSAGVVLNTVMKFLSSADAEINASHIESDSLSKSETKALLKQANKAWLLMQDTSNKEVPMPHDGYLKQYQLSGVQIDVDYILFDESQDANAVNRAIVASQSAKKVYVGDTNQSIYGFRGAIDSMAQLGIQKRYYLTNSFRFGDGVALFANTVLSEHQYHANPIKGAGKHETVFEVDRDYPHTVLCRTNGMLFSEAVNALRAEKPFHLVGGVKNYRFDTVLDAWFLKNNQKSNIKDKFIQSFAGFDEMLAYSEALDDKELKFLARVVKDHGRAIPSLIEEIQKKAIETPTGNEIIMTTGHRSKGLEWMDVVLTEDFTDMLEQKDPVTQKVRPPDQQEINLLYVVSTRAKRGLKLPDNIIAWLEKHHRDLAKMIRTRNKAGNTDLQRLVPNGSEPKHRAVDSTPEKEPASALAARYKKELLSSFKKVDKKMTKELLAMAEQFAEEAAGCEKGNPKRAMQMACASGLISALLDGDLKFS